MTRSHLSGVGTRIAAWRLRAESAITVLGVGVVIATAQLIAGCTDEAEREPQQPVQPAERKSAIHTAQQKLPSDEQPLDGPAFRLQQKRDWWSHAREVLFSDIELSAEQARAVDAMIEAQLNKRALLQRRDAEINAVRRTRDQKRIKAAREEFRALQAQLKKPHEIYEEMREVLAEQQRPAFDMNRARLVAEAQGSGRIRPEERAEQAEPDHPLTFSRSPPS